MLVKCCPECGAEQIDTVNLGGLEAHYVPPFAYYKGVRLNLTFSEARMVYMLVRRRRVSSDSLAILPNGEYAGQGSVRSRAAKIRSEFERASVPFKIKAIHGYGYELVEIIA